MRARISTPSTSRSAERLKYELASTAQMRPFLRPEDLAQRGGVHGEDVGLRREVRDGLCMTSKETAQASQRPLQHEVGL